MRVTDASEACLGTETLVAVLEGVADAGTRVRVEDHASRCVSCRQQLSSLARSGTPRVGVGVPGRRERRIAPGTQLDRYVVIGEIAAGGMGVVHAAHDPALHRRVAIKLLHGDSDPQLQERLRREAQVMAQLAHPNVVTVHDVGVFDGDLFIAMEYVEGETLASWSATPRPWREIVEAYRAAGRGLAAAHAAGIVHRDFKPENVLIGSDGRVRVGDFGLARPDRGQVTAPRLAAGSQPVPSAAAGLVELTASGALLGTPRYIAPELYSGGEADARSDQFSFCVALFTTLYGVPPFAGDSLESLAIEVRAGRMREPAGARRIPRRIRAALRRGLAVRREDRFSTIDELLASLTASQRRWRWLAAQVALTAAAVVALAGIARTSDDEPACGGAAAAIDRVWSAPRKAAVAAGLRAAGLPYGDASAAEVVRVLSRYAADWRSQRDDACRATRVRREQSDDVLDLRIGCLDRRLQRLDAIADVLATPSRTAAEHAVDEAQALPAIADCADIAALTSPVRPPNARIKRRVGELRSTLATLDAQRAAGRYELTLPAAESVVEEARRLPYRPLEAEALVLVGQLQKLRGHFGPAQAAYEQAQLAAEAGHDDRLLAAAAIELVDIVAKDLGKPEELARLRDHASALLERIDHPPELEARLLELLGSVEIRTGDLAAAERDLGDALAMRRRLHSDHDLRLVPVLHNLAYLEMQRAHYEQARPYVERALAIQRPLLGEQHPAYAESLEFLGGVEAEIDHNAEAEATYRRILPIYESAHGPDSTPVASLLGNLARVELKQSKAADALADYRRAYAIELREVGPRHEMTLWLQMGIATALQASGHKPDARVLLRRVLDTAREALGPEHQTIAMVLEALGDLELELHDYGAARGHFRESLAMDRRVLGADYPGTESLRGLGEAAMRLGEPVSAVASLEESRRTVHSDIYDTGIALIDSWLGRALVDSGRDRVRGRQLVIRAWPVLAADKNAEDEAADLAAWMKAHQMATSR